MSLDILKELIENNSCFSEQRCNDYKEIVKKQTPKVTLITCSDSRVPPHCLHADTVNNVFTIENMGNQACTCEGTMDYGVLHLKTPLLVILGHSNCGAVTASHTDYSGEPDSIKKELDTIKNARKKEFDEDDKERINKASELNLDHQISFAMDKYSELVESGNLNIVGLMFDFSSSYGSRCGAVHITNINGETDTEKLKEIAEGMPVKRITE